MSDHIVTPPRNFRTFTHRPQHGFTLLEILVAFTILAMALGALFQVFGGGLRSMGVATQYSRAALIAESRLALLGVESGLSAGTVSGVIDDLYRWQAVIEPYTDADLPDPDSLEVVPFTATVEVSWDDGGQQRTIALTTLKLAVRR